MASVPGILLDSFIDAADTRLPDTLPTCEELHTLKPLGNLSRKKVRAIFGALEYAWREVMGEYSPSPVLIELLFKRPRSADEALGVYLQTLLEEEERRAEAGDEEEEEEEEAEKREEEDKDERGWRQEEGENCREMEHFGKYQEEKGGCDELDVYEPEDEEEATAEEEWTTEEGWTGEWHATEVEETEATEVEDSVDGTEQFHPENDQSALEQPKMNAPAVIIQPLETPKTSSNLSILYPDPTQPNHADQALLNDWTITITDVDALRTHPVIADLTAQLDALPTPIDLAGSLRIRHRHRPRLEAEPWLKVNTQYNATTEGEGGPKKDGWKRLGRMLKGLPACV
ncbi:hypothetical protein CcaverHIS002_0301950 [Cutaneotrichosporon cavernicola]|uniref:Uncharacterized protein n=1 Tax=Cutaneotrichosporon cavernicola TaxID=279322 RepID=A0AA48IAK6_9TREE|nr:uncharacterized protein CcaverHIS019_0301900 [Cutaneotrichosporon cavernicola]BEI82327.1 hypothetical protein CcaverHIS002_0301950 [Cutaneotrichosporon cavernicola]BEI90120.1 hypothetical protein CcaverHIS019_0301900 [Cutaneotrichosporon cavernicola]BEI97898.1 hypothetical protein CcaverHIS631_0301970 [Cutaneotrichosporon cavernicola]BEJ05676.1 hypothetical protein CcaverHIS641_0301980 [Cutaneotrichosporon cavernicola]